MSELSDILDLGWQRLSRGVADRRAPARHPVLATVSPDGLPEARTVVLRGARRSASEVEVHTDLRSAKVTSLRAQPVAQMMIWDPRPQLQLRLTARFDILTGPDADARWAKVPDGSRVAYHADPAPGTPIDAPLAYEKHGAPEGFAVLLGTLDQIELMSLNGPHRRALYTAQDGWAGQWITP